MFSTHSTDLGPDGPADAVRLADGLGRDLVRGVEECLGRLRPDDVPALLEALQHVRAVGYGLILRVLASRAMTELEVREHIANLPTWLHTELRVDRRVAQAMARSARRIDEELRATGEALMAGEITGEHVDAMAEVVAGYPAGMSPESRRAAESKLLRVARVQAPSGVRGEARGVLEESDPEAYDRDLGARLEAQERRAARDRYLVLRSDGPGRTRISGLLPAPGAEIVRTALDSLAKPDLRPEPEPDSPLEPGTTLEPEVRESGWEPRTVGQRTADALTQLAEWFLASGDAPGSFARGASAAKVVVTVDRAALESGRGAGTLLRTGERVSIRMVEEFLCDGQLAYATTGAESTELAPVGPDPTRPDPTRPDPTGPDPAATDPGPSGACLTDAKRFFTGKLRELLELRDGGCAFPGCESPPSWCHGHHVRPYARGGRTTLDNGVLLCRFHHGVVHASGWDVRINPADRLPEFLPPARLDPARTARRNARTRLAARQHPHPT